MAPGPPRPACAARRAPRASSRARPTIALPSRLRRPPLSASAASAAASAAARPRASSSLGGGTSMEARIDASAPMMPTPANITNVAMRRPSRDRVVVTVAHGGNRDEAPPERSWPVTIFASGEWLSDLEDQHAGRAEHHSGRDQRDEHRVLPAVLEHVLDQRGPVAMPRSSLATRASRLSRARRGRPPRTGRVHSDGNGAQQVQPPALLDPK